MTNISHNSELAAARGPAFAAVLLTVSSEFSDADVQSGPATLISAEQKPAELTQAANPAADSQGAPLPVSGTSSALVLQPSRGNSNTTLLKDVIASNDASANSQVGITASHNFSTKVDSLRPEINSMFIPAAQTGDESTKITALAPDSDSSASTASDLVFAHAMPQPQPNSSTTVRTEQANSSGRTPNLQEGAKPDANSHPPIATVEPVLAESSIPVSEKPVASTTTRSAEPNSEKLALPDSVFASVLFRPFYELVSGSKVQDEPATSGEMPLHSDAVMKRDGNVTASLSSQTEGSQAPREIAPRPQGKASKRTHEIRPDSRIAAPTISFCPSSGPTNDEVRSFAANSLVLSNGNESGDSPVPATDAQSNLEKFLYALSENTVSDSPVEIISQQITTSPAAPISSAIADPAAVSSSEQRALPIGVEANQIVVHPVLRTVPPANLAEPSATEPLGSMTIVRADSNSQSPAEQSLPAKANPAPDVRPPAPNVQHPKAQNNAPTQLHSAVSNAQSAGTSDPTDVIAKADLIGMANAIPARAPNGAAAHTSPSIEKDRASLIPSISGFTFDAPKSSADLKLIQPSDAASSLPITSVHVESSSAAAPTLIPSWQTVSQTAGQRLGLSQPSDADSPKDSSPKSDSAPSNSDQSPHKDDGKNPANHSLNSATDRRPESSAVSTSDSAPAQPTKIDQMAAARAPQSAAAEISSPTSTGKPVQGDASARIAAVDAVVKEGHPSEAAGNPISDGGQHAAAGPSAQLTSQISKSDVKIALQGEQFGSVELRAKVTGDQVSASITVEHHETHAMLSGELPVLHQALNERQLRVSEIVLLHDSLMSGGSSGDGSAPKQGERSPQTAGNSSANNLGESISPVGASDGRAGAIPIFDSRGRLSVRA